PNDKGFTLLTPRRAFSATSGVIEAVKALTCPHNHFSDYWNGVSGSYGVEVDNYGIGDAIRAYSASTAKNYAAVYAVNVATTGVGTAVYGSSDHGNGVYAYSGTGDGLEATTSSTSMSAIYAHSINGNGVWAVSTNRIGVHGYSTAVEGVGGESTNSYGVRGYNNHDTATAGNYGGYFTAANYRGGFLATLITTSWYGALIDGGIMVTNGGCTGCTLMYVGMNQGTEALRPGDLLAVAGVEVDAVTGQPVMQVRLATSASDPLIGVVVSGASKPGGQGPDKIQSEKILSGEYVLIAAGGLVQARVADLNVAIGGYLQAGPAGGVATANMERSGVRVMSEPDANGLVWVMISGN
ncbi:MAG TPA: hypothetical protein VFF78_04660, partial [Anaerolineaceae bacterium]|nr:hypothetical protein [Anaerolineaceae bacterium]